MHELHSYMMSTTGETAMTLMQHKVSQNVFVSCGHDTLQAIAENLYTCEGLQSVIKYTKMQDYPVH